MPKESGRPLKIEVVAPPGAMRSAPRLFAILEQASESADEYGPIKKSMGRSIPRPSSKPEHNTKCSGNAGGKGNVRRVGWNLDSKSTCRSMPTHQHRAAACGERLRGVPAGSAVKSEPSVMLSTSLASDRSSTEMSSSCRTLSGPTRTPPCCTFTHWTSISRAL